MNLHRRLDRLEDERRDRGEIVVVFHSDDGLINAADGTPHKPEPYDTTIDLAGGVSVEDVRAVWADFPAPEPEDEL